MPSNLAPNQNPRNKGYPGLRTREFPGTTLACPRTFTHLPCEPPRIGEPTTAMLSPGPTHDPCSRQDANGREFRSLFDSTSLRTAALLAVAFV